MGCIYTINPATQTLDIEITGSTQYLAAKKSFSIPLSHVQTPVVPKPNVSLFRNIQFGVYSPNYCAGTFYPYHGFFNFEKKIFVYKKKTLSNTVMFKLTDEDSYDKIIIDVPEGVENVGDEAVQLTKLIEMAKC